MKLVVTGGAGYIGSHAVKALLKAGHEVIVFDNLSKGHRAAVGEARLVEGDLRDEVLLTRILRDERIDAVMHFAALAQVGESVQQPAWYYGNNVLGTFHLLEAMRTAGVQKLVFSSTTATFGAPESMPIHEELPQRPINPYGFTKLVVEHMLDDYSAAYGLSFAALRYFNAAGASPDGDIGEDHTPESHLIPIVLQVALGQRNSISVFGDDYPTPDGTCIRDYIHVDDLAEAHILALEQLQPGKKLKLNLGIGTGYSVRQVIDACRKVTGHAIPETISTRREGDPPELVADSRLARKVLGWKPRFDTLESIVETAWKWHRAHPEGYASKG